jgi:hypothetical protein
MNRNCIGKIREVTGEELDCEELDLVSGGGGAAVLGSLTGGVVATLMVVADTVARVAGTVTGHSC